MLGKEAPGSLADDHSRGAANVAPACQAYEASSDSIEDQVPYRICKTRWIVPHRFLHGQPEELIHSKLEDFPTRPNTDAEEEGEER